MQKVTRFLKSISKQPVQILDTSIALEAYVAIDFSIKNPALQQIEIARPDECQKYIDKVLKLQNSLVAFGGYLEKRSLYDGNPSFSSLGEPVRNIHLGVDFWSSVGTKVIAPLDGKVHSFKNNAKKGDYGPTIVLEHIISGLRFHTLYGHLSLKSLENLYVGKTFTKGQELATLGDSDINVGYAPHLHFQIVVDMEGKKGDYPGVCSVQNLGFYSQNCPDPNLLLGIRF